MLKLVEGKITIRILFLILIITGILTFNGNINAANLFDSSSANFPGITSTDRILIFSPHPDDESLAAGGLIKYASKRNIPVLVVEMTSGEEMDPQNFQKYLNKTKKRKTDKNIGILRQAEVLTAVKYLGLEEDDVIFLGYPDGSLKTLFDENWEYNDLLVVEEGSGGFDHTPYNSSYEPHAPICGANLAKNVEQIIIDYQPTIIIYPDGIDYHPDHFATSAFVRYAEIQTNYTGKSYSYLVHYPDWPTPPYYSPHTDLHYPYSVNSSNTISYNRILNQEEESAKKKAIESYRTQLIVNNRYYLSFIRNNEIFTTYPDLDIQKVNRKDSYLMPHSSYAKTEINIPEGKDLFNISTESGVACDDKNLYLLIKTSYKSDNLTFTYHIKPFNGKSSDKMDITVRNENAILISENNETIKSIKLLDVKSEYGIKIISMPLSLFSDVQQIMLSLEYTHPLDYRDSIPWRLYKF